MAHPPDSGVGKIFSCSSFQSFIKAAFFSTSITIALATVSDSSVSGMIDVDSNIGSNSPAASLMVTAKFCLADCLLVVPSVKHWIHVGDNANFLAAISCTTVRSTLLPLLIDVKLGNWRIFVDGEKVLTTDTILAFIDVGGGSIH